MKLLLVMGCFSFSVLHLNYICSYSQCQWLWLFPFDEFCHQAYEVFFLLLVQFLFSSVEMSPFVSVYPVFCAHDCRIVFIFVLMMFSHVANLLVNVKIVKCDRP